MRSFDPVRAWELIEQERITTGLAVPAMLNFMTQVPNYERFDFSTVRWIMTGAAPVPVALIEQPFAPPEWEEFAALAAECSVPLMLDESIWSEV